MLARARREAFESLTGRGVRGRVKAAPSPGKSKILEELRVDPGALAAKAEALRADGQTVMFVVVDGKDCGTARRGRPDQANHAGGDSQIHADGIRIVMLTGDSRTTAEAVATS